MSDVPVITASELTKTYGETAAVDHVSFTVDAGESFGLLGPNGAGKSTAMRMIGAVTGRTSGKLSVLGYDPHMLLLDEPTTGLDPQARHILWDRLFRLKKRGVTLIVTTHFMDEAEQLCDRLMVVDRGQVIAEGSPAQLIGRYATREVLELRFGSEQNANAATALSGIGERMEVLPDRILVYNADGDAELARVHDLGLIPVTSLVRRSSLEDVFLRLTGRSLIE